MRPPDTRTPRRSARVTILAWLVIAAAALGTVLSLFVFLMSVSHHYGSSGDVSGFLLIVVAPPVTLVAGIALLLRKRWARLYLIAVCLIFLGATAVGIAKDPTPRHTYVSPSGVPTTVLASEVSYHVPLIVISLGVLLALFSPGARADFASPKGPPPLPGSATPARSGSGGSFEKNRLIENERGWRVGHRGRDSMLYEEQREGAWHPIEIQGEMLTGRAHHVIYFASPAAWQSYPEWARHRRDEIIGRIKSEFRPPDYEYHGDDAGLT